MFGYVLLTLGASELIYVVMSPNTFSLIGNEDTFRKRFWIELKHAFTCTGCTREKTSCSWSKALVLFLFAPVFYAICGLIVFICVDSV